MQKKKRHVYKQNKSSDSSIDLYERIQKTLRFLVATVSLRNHSVCCCKAVLQEPSRSTVVYICATVAFKETEEGLINFTAQWELNSSLLSKAGNKI